MVFLWSLSDRLLILIYHWQIFSHRFWLVVFHWCLSKSNSLQISKTLFSIQADLNCAVILMVSILSLTFDSFNLFFFRSPLGTVLSAPITIGITVTLLFQNLFFFRSLARSKYLPIFLLSFHFFLSMVHWNIKIHLMVSSFFLLVNATSSQLIRLYHQISLVSFLKTVL